MKSFKIAVAALLIVMLASGFVPRNNLKDLSIVEGLGFDAQNGQIKATLQSLNLIKEGNGAEALSSNVTMNNDGVGATISCAIDDVSKSLSKKLFFGQNRIVVFGMPLAKSELDKSLDYFLRSSDSRADVVVAIAEGEAAEIMESPQNSSLVPAQTISSLLLLSERNGFGANVTTSELLNTFSDKTSDIYLPVLKAQGENVTVSGIAIYNKQRLVHILDKDETYGFMLLRDKAEEGLLSLYDEKLGKISINIISARVKTKAAYNGNNVVFNAKIRASIMLNEYENGVTNGLSQEQLDMVEHLAENKLQELCGKAFYACTANGSDALKIGEHLAMYNPRAYSALSDNWEDSIKSARLETDIKCKINKINENSEGN